MYIFILPKLVEYLSICIQRIKKINFISLLKSTIKILLALLVIFFYSMIALSGILEKNPIPFVLCSIPLWIFLIKYQFKSKWDSIRYYFYGITLWFLATYYLLTSYVMALWLLWGLHDEWALTALWFFWIFAGGFIAVPVLLVLSSICLYKLLYRKSEFEQWKSLIWFCVPGVVYLPMLIAGFPHTPIGDVVMSFFNGMIH